MKNEKLKLAVAFVLGIALTMVACMGYVGSLKDGYDKELSSRDQCIDRLTEYYNEKVVDLDELKSEHAELEEGVYNIIEGEEYDVSIHHGDDTIIYKAKKTGMFDSLEKTKIIVH